MLRLTKKVFIEKYPTKYKLKSAMDEKNLSRNIGEIAGVSIILLNSVMVGLRAFLPELTL